MAINRMDDCNWNCELTQFFLKGITASPCFKETQYPRKYDITASVWWPIALILAFILGITNF